MSKLSTKRCKFSECCPVNENDELDDFSHGEYGYRVFFETPKAWLRDYFDADYLDELGDSLVNGELEFTVDGDGDQVGEVLLWATIKDDMADDGFINDDYVDAFGHPELEAVAEELAKTFKEQYMSKSVTMEEKA